MRAKEFLYEDYTQRLENDLANLLVGAKGGGAQKLDTDALINAMQGMGYSVDADNIMTLLQTNPNIVNSTPDEVTLTGSEEQGGADQEEDSAARVSDMAQAATKIG